MGAFGRKRALVLAAVILGVVLAAVVLDLSTASPRVCASCHEMTSRAGSWERSAHVTVACVKCHEAPHAWYALPARLVDRGKLFARDIGAHISGDYPTQVETRSADVAPVADVVCLQCHSPNRTATSGYRILIDHAEHAKRNGSCVSCHVRTAHPEQTRGNALTLMAQCFTCHGTAEKPDASATCAVCHPSGYELVPASHSGAQWKDGRHGDIALADVKLCGMCHEQRLCDDCHGVQMPHPAGWTKETTGHAAVARTDPTVCSRCHGGKPDMCTMCHHAEYDPKQGAWLDQHGQQVDKGGAAHCIECHGPLSCVQCHVRADR
ncbi:MAG: hypothetical protein D9V44_07140 [Actinobacteria bacterium]|nr:MAG: hypothetical protein D9V44_07140 [Actinomycetota bacterium]